MFKVENNVKYYLYNKISQKVEAVFSNKFEIRNYIDSVMKRMIFIHPEEDNTYPYGLSMSPDLEYKCISEYVLNYAYRTDYIPNPKTQYVIIDSNYKIFNYTEIVDEINAYNSGVSINFGIGKTYKGNSNEPIHNRRKRCVYSTLTHGSKRHKKGKGTYHLIVNKAERSATVNFSHIDANDISCYIAEEMNVDVHPNMIQKAYNSMRSKRKNFANNFYDDEYTYESYRYGCCSSWKKSKKSKQWKNNKNTSKQTAQKDYIKKCIDKEYSYEYENENIA